MSSDAKGTRKPKRSTNTSNTKTGKFKLNTELIISMLVAGLYALFLVETRLATGVTALMLSMFLVVTFLVFVYIVRGGTHKKKQEFGSLLYVFLGLAALSLVWELLRYFNVVDTSKISPAILLVIGVVYAVVSVVIIAVLVFLEKSSLKDLYLTPGDSKVIPFAVVAFILCALLGIGATYILFGGSTLGQQNLITLIVAVLVFSLLAGIAGELWFRGLLMSRITPILGETYGNIYQAVVFGVFEAVIFYMITGQISLMPAIFIIGSMTGYYWGRATVRSKSVISPMLLHAGFYVLVALPILVGLTA